MTSSDELLIDSDIHHEMSFTRPTSAKEMLHTIAMQVFNRGREEHIDGEGARLSKLVEQIALIMSKTYAELGDAYQLADDEALTMIRDLLLQYNPAIINRNKKGRIPKS